MRGCRQALAGFVAVLFVVTAVPLFFVINLARSLTDRADLVEALQLEPALRPVLPQLVAEGIQNEIAQRGLPPVSIDPAVLAPALEQIIPAGWIDGVVDTAVTHIFDYFESGDLAQLNWAMDLQPILTRLRGQPGQQLILSILQSLPACSAPLSEFDLSSGSVEIPNCLPPELSLNEVAAQIHNVMVETLDANPQLLTDGRLEMPIFDAELTPEEQTQWGQLRQVYLAGRLSWLLWGVPVGLLLLILMLAVRSGREWGQWWGWPLLLAGVFSLLLAVIIPALFTIWWRTAVPPLTNADALGAAVWQMGQQTIHLLLTLWVKRIYWQAGLMVFLGLVLAAMGFLLPSRPLETTYS